jgi:hypothetical protein
MQNHQEAHQVPPGAHEVNQVPPGADHVNLIHEELYQVRRHRHEGWASFSLPLCAQCLQEHVWKYLVRYPVAAVDQEACQCPCIQNPEGFLTSSDLKRGGGVLTLGEVKA